jgi:hypothetical protein
MNKMSADPSKKLKKSVKKCCVFNFNVWGLAGKQLKAIFNRFPTKHKAEELLNQFDFKWSFGWRLLHGSLLGQPLLSGLVLLEVLEVLVQPQLSLNSLRDLG